MIRFLASTGLVVVLFSVAVQGDLVYSKIMTPRWLYENAHFNPSVVQSYQQKRLSLRLTEKFGRLLTVPLPSVKSLQGDVVFKITVSLKKPTRDSDLLVGIGNARGVSAAAYIIDNRPYATPLATVSSEQRKVTHADVRGSTVLSGPFDEQVIFVYKP